MKDSRKNKREEEEQEREREKRKKNKKEKSKRKGRIRGYRFITIAPRLQCVFFSLLFSFTSGKEIPFLCNSMKDRQ